MLFAPRYYLAIQLSTYPYRPSGGYYYYSFYRRPYFRSEWNEIKNSLGIRIPFFSKVEKLFASLDHSTPSYYMPEVKRIWLANRYGWINNSEIFAFLLDRAAMDSDSVVRATAIAYAASLLPKDASFDSFLEVRQKVEPNKSLCNYVKALADFRTTLAAKQAT
jgi:hypothetical protein